MSQVYSLRFLEFVKFTANLFILYSSCLNIKSMIKSIFHLNLWIIWMKLPNYLILLLKHLQLRNLQDLFDAINLNKPKYLKVTCYYFVIIET